MFSKDNSKGRQNFAVLHVDCHTHKTKTHYSIIRRMISFLLGKAYYSSEMKKKDGI
jgi:hypothetical protein